MRVYQLPNGKWTHSRTSCEYDVESGAQMDARFLREWEEVRSNSHTESDFQ